jgi:hypothetical protein
MYVPEMFRSPEKETLADVIPLTFSQPLSEQAAKARRLRFHRRGFIQIETPREDEIASDEEKKRHGWEEE